MKNDKSFMPQWRDAFHSRAEGKFRQKSTCNFKHIFRHINFFYFTFICFYLLLFAFVLCNSHNQKHPKL